MKIARIQHHRCGSYESSTLVWVPDDMLEEQLETLVEKARKDCLDAERSVKGETAPPYRTYWDWQSRADKNKTLTVLEAEYAAHKAIYDAWAAKRDAARKDFASRLKDLSDGQITRFFDGDFPLDVDCNWGHNHGVKVDYGETDL